MEASWYQPKKPTEPEVSEAVERAFQFQLGWFAEPIFRTGDYPKVMKDKILAKSLRQGMSSRLQIFSAADKEMIKGMMKSLSSNIKIMKKKIKKKQQKKKNTIFIHGSMQRQTV